MIERLVIGRFFRRFGSSERGTETLGARIGPVSERAEWGKRGVVGHHRRRPIDPSEQKRELVRWRW